MRLAGVIVDEVEGSGHHRVVQGDDVSGAPGDDVQGLHGEAGGLTDPGVHHPVLSKSSAIGAGTGGTTIS